MEKGSRRRDKKNGLIPGDKIKNQVGVPDFVYSNTNYIVRGLKGLYDTDGGITVNLDKRIVLNFENHSVTLLRDFQHMCSKIGVNATLSIKSNQVSITETSSVKKFLYIVNPVKINSQYRRIWLGVNILKKNAPVKIKNCIRTKLKNFKNQYKRLKFEYSLSHLKLLKEWVEGCYKENMSGIFREYSDIVSPEDCIDFESSFQLDITAKLVDYLINLTLTEDVFRIMKLKKDSDEIYSLDRDILIFCVDYVFLSVINNRYENNQILINKLIRKMIDYYFIINK